jgi:hypothetical protein
VVKIHSKNGLRGAKNIKKPPVVNGGKMIMKRNIWGKIAS